MLVFLQVAVFFGGLSIKKDEEELKKNSPHIVVGTPGRILALTRSKTLNLRHIKHFILDECDKMLEQLGKWHNPLFKAKSDPNMCQCLKPRNKEEDKITFKPTSVLLALWSHCGSFVVFMYGVQFPFILWEGFLPPLGSLQQ